MSAIRIEFMLTSAFSVEQVYGDGEGLKASIPFFEAENVVAWLRRTADELEEKYVRGTIEQWRQK